MKKMIVALLMMLTMPAIADVSIYTGGDAGIYFKRFGPNLQGALSEFSAFNVKEGGERVNIVKTKGSLDNFSKVSKDPNSVGYGQSDAWQFWASENPEGANSVEELGQLDNDECLFVIRKKGGPIESLDDLTKSSTRIAIGSPDSGSNASWNFITKLDPSYKQVQTKSIQGERVLPKLTLAKDSKQAIDAYFLVTSRTTKSNDILNAVNVKGSQLELMDFNDSDFNEKLPNGVQVYEFKDSDVGGNSVEVPCTKTVLVGNAEGNEDLLNLTAKILLNNPSRLVSDK